MKQQKSQGTQGIIRIAGTLLLLVLFAMFSCTKDQENQDPTILQPVEFELAKSQTRATDTNFDNGDKIGIYAVESGKSFIESGNYADNRQYSYKDGKFQPVSAADKIFVVNGKKYIYYAYYPYRQNINPANIEFNAVDITTKNRPLWSMYNTNTGNVVKLPFENIFGLVEININETADKIVSGSMLNQKSKVSVNLCQTMLTSPSQSPVSIPLTLYNSANSLSTFRTLLPNGNKISVGDELFNFITASSKSKKYYATESSTITAGIKNVFNLTLLEEYLIKATSTIGGSITDAAAWASGKTFQDGQSCSLFFAADNGYYFDGIYENNVKQNCISSPYTFNVTGNRTLEARFKPNEITYGSWTVSVSANPVTIAAGGGTSTITATATRDVFTNGIKTGTDTATPTLTATGTGFTLSGRTLTASNNTGSSRSCSVRATYSGVSKTCTVTQSAANITYGSWTVNVSANPTVIAAGGGTSTITATAIRDVFTNGTKTGTDTAEPSLSVSGTGFSLSNKILTASNNIGASRSCTVRATYSGVSNTCTVTQSAANITYGDWVVSVSASPTTIAASGGTSTITATATRDVFTNGTKTGTDTAEPSLSYRGTGFTLSGKTLTASENTGASRSCRIGATYDGVNKTCVVTQNAAEITYGSWTVSVSANPVTIPAGGGTSTITATATRDVFTNGTKTGTDTATPTLTATGTGFTLSGRTLTASNNVGSSRSCTVRATYSGVSKTCTVTQSAAQITWQYSLSVTPTFLSFSSKGQSKSFTVTSKRTKVVNGTVTSEVENAPYSTSISGPNASAFSVSGTSVTASANSTTDFRDGTLKIQQTGSGGKSATITLEQEGKINIDTEI